jgi:predicted anti-sigma-YlaC factor YlaD
MGEGCTCEHCEQVMQPYLDRVLTSEEQASAEEHLASCS